MGQAFQLDRPEPPILLGSGWGKEEDGGWVEGPHSTSTCPVSRQVEHRVHLLAVLQVIIVAGHRKGLRPEKGSATPSPKEPERRGFKGSPVWCPPGQHPQCCLLNTLGHFQPSWGPGQAKCQSPLAVPGAGASLLQAGRILICYWLHSLLALTPVPSHSSWAINPPAPGWSFIHLPASLPSSFLPSPYLPSPLSPPMFLSLMAKSLASGARLPVFESCLSKLFSFSVTWR